MSVWILLARVWKPVFQIVQQTFKQRFDLRRYLNKDELHVYIYLITIEFHKAYEPYGYPVRSVNISQNFSFI